MIPLLPCTMALVASMPFLASPAPAAGDIKLSDFLFHPNISSPSPMQLTGSGFHPVLPGVEAMPYPAGLFSIGFVGVVPDPLNVSFGSNLLSAQNVLLELDTPNHHSALLLYRHHELLPPVLTSSQVYYGAPLAAQSTDDIKTMDPAVFGGDRLYVTEYSPQSSTDPAYGMIQVLGPPPKLHIGGESIEFEWIGRFEAPKAGEDLQIRARPFTNQTAIWNKHGTMCTEFEVTGGRDMDLDVIEFEGVNVALAGQKVPGKVQARIYDSASQALLWWGTKEIAPPATATGTVTVPVHVQVVDMFGAPIEMKLEHGKKYRIGMFWDQSVNGHFKVVRASEGQLPQIDARGLFEMTASYYSDADTFPMSLAIEQQNVTPLVQRVVMMRFRVKVL